MKDYDQFGEIAEKYKDDAFYFAGISTNLGAGAEELSASVQNISSILGTINTSQGELNKAVHAVNDRYRRGADKHKVTSGHNGSVSDISRGQQIKEHENI